MTRTGAPGRAVIVDREGLVAKRYDASDGTAILFRPDQHVCARWRRFDLDQRARGDRTRDRERLESAMAKLNTEPNLPAPDDFYEQLIATHRGLTDAQSALVNAKLVLLLANHIGDPAVLAQAMAAAREGVVPIA